MDCVYVSEFITNYISKRNICNWRQGVPCRADPLGSVIPMIVLKGRSSFVFIILRRVSVIKARDPPQYFGESAQHTWKGISGVSPNRVDWRCQGWWGEAEKAGGRRIEFILFSCLNQSSSVFLSFTIWNLKKDATAKVDWVSPDQTSGYQPVRAVIACSCLGKTVWLQNDSVTQGP